MSSDGFGDRIKEERQRLKLNQAEFAALGGVARASQTNYEAEQRVPDLRYLAGIGERADVLYVVNGKRSDAGSAKSIDARSIQIILAAIESWAKESRRELTEHFRAELVALFLQQLITHGKIDASLITSTLKLVK